MIRIWLAIWLVQHFHTERGERMPFSIMSFNFLNQETSSNFSIGVFEDIPHPGKIQVFSLKSKQNAWGITLETYSFLHSTQKLVRHQEGLLLQQQPFRCQSSYWICPEVLPKFWKDHQIKRFAYLDPCWSNGNRRISVHEYTCPSVKRK